MAEGGGVPRTVSDMIGLVVDSASGTEVLAHLGAITGLPMAANCTLVTPDGGRTHRLVRHRWAGLLLGGRLLPAIRESARRNSLRHLFAATSIELGQLGPEAVTYGAATLPMEDFLNGASRPPLGNRRASIGLQP